VSYSTPASVRQALVPSSDGSLPETATHTAADLTDVQLQDAIAEADAVIDSYIGGFYGVPVAMVNGATPHPVDFWSRNIAAYNATLAFRGSQDFADTDPVARRYKDTMQALAGVSTGTLKLQLPDNTSDNAAAGAGAPLNPYVGDLWTPDDFDLCPITYYPWRSF
jgi:phage gp36-like protein